MLNGNLSYTTSGVASAVTNLQINSAWFPAAAQSRWRSRSFRSGKTAALTYQGGNISGNTVTLQVAGNLGSTQLSFASGTTVSSIATAINGVKATTGLSAQVSGTAPARQLHGVWFAAVRQHSGDRRQTEAGVQRHQSRRQRTPM